ncbi:putative ycf54 protein [Dioscorea sansibarensis]
MVAPATLALGPCAALPVATVAGKVRRTLQLVLPGSPHLQSSASSLPKSCILRSSRALSFSPAAVAVDSDHSGSSQTDEKEKPMKYYFLVANAKFMLDEEEHFKELLFERLRLFGERDKEQDFWLVIEPKFLDKFPDITKRLKRPAVALVSTNGRWITFMKLRLDRVLPNNFDADSLEEALDSNPVDLKFDKPEKWVAPYPKYEFGWWEPFLPPVNSKTSS